MAKKADQPRETSRGRNAAEKRRGPRTAADLLEESKRIGELAKRLAVHAEVVKTKKMPSITVDGVTKVDRALAELEGYIKAVKVAIVRGEDG